MVKSASRHRFRLENNWECRQCMCTRTQSLVGIVIVIQTVAENTVEISALPAANLIFVGRDNIWRHRRYWCSTS